MSFVLNVLTFTEVTVLKAVLLCHVRSDIDNLRLSQSRSQRILWLLEELKVDYELKTYQRQHMLAPEELKKIHPLGKSPVIAIEADALAKPLVLAESGLIVEYLVDHFGPNLAPKKWAEGKENQVGGESEEWIRYRYYMHYAEGSYMILLVVALLVGSKSATINVAIGYANTAPRHKVFCSALLLTSRHQQRRRQDRVDVPDSQLQDSSRFPGEPACDLPP